MSTNYCVAELEALMADLESDLVARKESAADLKEVRRNVCAFANDLPGNGRPGVVLIGVQDDGSCASLSIDDKLLQRLADVRSAGSIQPLPSISVQKHVLKGCEVAVVTVAPHEDTPVRYNGRVYVRVGPSVRLASVAEEKRLEERRRSTDLPFDMRPAPGASSADVDLDFVCSHYLPNAIAPEILAENSRPLEQQLRSLRLLQAERPTRGAILALGRDPRAFLPGAYVQFLRLDNAEITGPIRDQKALTGRLDDVLRQLDELLKLNISIRTKIAGAFRERRQPEYPIDALRQLAHNAVMHRRYEVTNAPIRIHWFTDRVEIISPGGLYGRVTPDNFGKGDTDYRNPLLAEIMYHLGFAQRFGLGIPLARKALAENGNPLPAFDFQPTLVAATVRAVP